jgi:predicted small secreted protein
MRKLLATLIVTLSALLLAGCGGGGGGNGDDTASPSPPGKTITFQIPSAYTNIAYDISVMLPADYETDPTPRPVIYSLDAESRFNKLSGVLNDMPNAAKRAILVGIGNQGNARRFIDFEMDGAINYYRFLTLEAIPAIDARFRTDPKTRILSGHSLSGLLVVYALFMEQPGQRYFSALMPEDSSVQFQPANVYAMEQQMFDTSHDLPVTLVMTTSALFKDDLALCEQIRARNYGGLKLKFLGYGQDHVGMDVFAFRDSLSFIFNLGLPDSGTTETCQ